MTNYVVGFLFDVDRQKLALIAKNRPHWQQGKWNGPGGKLESGETPLEAMIREFREETGQDIDSWEMFAELRTSGGVIYFFRAFSDLVYGVRSRTDEYVALFPVRALPAALLTNMSWLIPMALSMDADATCKFIIREEYENGDGFIEVFEPASCTGRWPTLRQAMKDV